MLDKFRLTDRVAVVTGAGSGIGRATSLAFAEAGANLVLAGVTIGDLPRSQADLDTVAARIRALGRRALTVVADVRDSAQVANMVAQALSEFGRIDILVNNAGGTFGAPALDISEAGWDAVIRENLKPVFLCSKAVARAMIDKGVKGCIVSLASVAGQGSARGLGGAHYGAAKAGIINLTQTLSVELAPHGIRVNAIAPGYIDTPGLSLLREKDPQSFARMERWVPLGRLGQPEDVAACALYLASDAASYITGQTIAVDGGRRGYGDS